MSAAIALIQALDKSWQRRRVTINAPEEFREHVRLECRSAWDLAWQHLHAIARPTLEGSLTPRAAWYWSERLRMAEESAAFFGALVEPLYLAKPQQERDLVFRVLVQLETLTRS